MPLVKQTTVKAPRVHYRLDFCGHAGLNQRIVFDRYAAARRPHDQEFQRFIADIFHCKICFDFLRFPFYYSSRVDRSGIKPDF